jgi:hypothetical protein
MKTDHCLCVCSYEDRPEAMDSLILMGESLSRAEPALELRLTVPEAPMSVRTWAKGKPKIVLSTEPPEGVSGWDVKPWLLLQELRAGCPEVLWLDADTVVTGPISPLWIGVPRDCLIVAEEWDSHAAIPVTHLWGWSEARPVRPINSCFVRVTQAHRPLLEQWQKMIHDSRYRAAQALPFERRPWHLASDQVLLTALLGSAGFRDLDVEYLRVGRHIAHCAGSSGYRPLHRLRDLFRGLPPLIHCIGRKPWMTTGTHGRLHNFLLDLAIDVSPYVLASRRIAKDLESTPKWIDSRTALGALLRGLTAWHPGLAGMPLAILHALQQKVNRLSLGRKKEKLGALLPGP